MRHQSILALALLIVALLVSLPGRAQETPQTWRVGVYLNPPFVMSNEGRISGMAIDLWDEVTRPVGIVSSYVEMDTIADLTQALTSGEIDAAVTNLTVNRQRASVMDFTHPWFDAGLRILVTEDRGAGFWDIVSGLNAAGYLATYGWIALVIVVASLLLTLFDRRFDKGFPKGWPDGLAESFYTVMSVATSGKPPNRKNLFGWVGRIWQGIWLACGVAVLAFVTSSVTSVMTVLTIQNHINSVADLPGKTIGVLTGSVGQSYAQRTGLRTLPFGHIEDAVAALRSNAINAIIADGPVLEYYAHINPDEGLSVVGPIFEPDKYAFALPAGSPMRRAISVEVVGASDTGRIQQLQEQYFGNRR